MTELEKIESQLAHLDKTIDILQSIGVEPDDVWEAINILEKMKKKIKK